MLSYNDGFLWDDTYILWLVVDNDNHINVRILLPPSDLAGHYSIKWYIKNTLLPSQGGCSSWWKCWCWWWPLCTITILPKIESLNQSFVGSVPEYILYSFSSSIKSYVEYFFVKNWKVKCTFAFYSFLRYMRSYSLTQEQGECIYFIVLFTKMDHSVQSFSNFDVEWPFVNIS